MSEIFTSKILANRKIRSTLAEFFSPKNRVNFLGRGLEGSVQRVGVSIEGRALPQGLAYKEYAVRGGAEQAVIAWRELKNIGIPVPKTFRIVGKPGEYTGILMTDLSRGWRDILLTSNETKAHTIDNVWKESPETVRKLAEIDVERVVEEQGLRNRFQEMAVLLANAGIEFRHSDVVSLIFTEAGLIEPMVSDMYNVDYQSRKPFDELVEINTKRFERSLFWLREGQRIAREVVKSA